MATVSVNAPPLVGERPSIPRQENGPLSAEALAGIVSRAWKRVLGIDLHSLSRDPGRQFAEDISVSASLPLLGESSLVVVLRTSSQVAVRAAVSVLGLHEDELAPGDIDDAFAGIVGAVGIGLRDVLPQVTRIGSPIVVQGSSLTSAVPGARLMCDASLRSGSGRVHVGLWHPRV